MSLFLCHGATFRRREAHSSYQNRPVKELLLLHAPEIQEEIVAFRNFPPQERISLRIVEQIVDAPVPQGLGTDHRRREGRPS